MLGAIEYPPKKEVRRATIGSCFVVLTDVDGDKQERAIEVWASAPLRCIARFPAVDLVSEE